MESKRRRQVTTQEFYLEQQRLGDVYCKVVTLTAKHARREMIITAVVSVILVGLIVMFAGCSVKDTWMRIVKTIPELTEDLCGEDQRLYHLCEAIPDHVVDMDCRRASELCGWYNAIFRSAAVEKPELTLEQIEELQEIKRKLEGGE